MTKKETKPRRPLVVRLTAHRRRLLRKYAKREGRTSAAWIAHIVSLILDKREEDERAARQLNLFEGGGVDGSS